MTKSCDFWSSSNSCRWGVWALTSPTKRGRTYPLCNIIAQRQNGHVIPAEAEIPDTTRQNKKRDARFHEHDNEKMYVILALNRNHVINQQNPPPTPPFCKWRGEKNNETSMSFLRKQESPTQPAQQKTRCPLSRAWQSKNACHSCGSRNPRQN